MQDSNTSRMSHNVYELLSYASNILTLNPGDVIAGGSPAGTNIERAEPRWMRAGDTAICAIEGIGTQRHAVVGGGTSTVTEGALTPLRGRGVTCPTGRCHAPSPSRLASTAARPRHRRHDRRGRAGVLSAAAGDDRPAVAEPGDRPAAGRADRGRHRRRAAPHARRADLRHPGRRQPPRAARRTARSGGPALRPRARSLSARRPVLRLDRADRTAAAATARTCCSTVAAASSPATPISVRRCSTWRERYAGTQQIYVAAEGIGAEPRQVFLRLFWTDAQREEYFAVLGFVIEPASMRERLFAGPARTRLRRRAAASWRRRAAPAPRHRRHRGRSSTARCPTTCRRPGSPSRCCSIRPTTSGRGSPPAVAPRPWTIEVGAPAFATAFAGAGQRYWPIGLSMLLMLVGARR